MEFRHLNKYLMSNGFRNNGGIFEYCLDGKVYFDIRDENAKPLNELGNYRTFSINSNYTIMLIRWSAIDKILILQKNICNILNQDYLLLINWS